ncbi:MAG: D-tyrosyl-tRNA(Tyr) deacylase [Bacilli bacterium]|nr:D-tyrosyl-tRNA(Tyr) deacylase [Bacilli bacterium]
MRVLIQRVTSASVDIEGERVASIGKGFLLLVGFTSGDTPEIADKMVQKVAKLRIFADENGKTNLALADIGGEVLSVSQFTLYADCSQGNRPSFVKAMKAEEANALYAYFFASLKALFPALQGGVFQTDMQVSLVNEGPFTVLLDSQELFK